MITGFDHLVLVVPDLKEGMRSFADLSGLPCNWSSTSGSGSASASFQLQNCALEVLAPQGDGPGAKRLGELLAHGGVSLQTVVFASDDLDADYARLASAGLHPGPISEGSSTHLLTGATRRWRSLRLGDGSGAVRAFVLQREVVDALDAAQPPPGSVNAVDHLVITSMDAERAISIYGEKLGLTLTMDRAMDGDGKRLLVFGCGDGGIEVMCRAGSSESPPRDRLWGATWRTSDIEAAHRRIESAGFDVSPVKQGIRRGTRVFTVRDGLLGVPTLILARDDR